MNNLNLYKILEKYAEYLYEEKNKVMKSHDTKRKRPYVRNNIENK